MAKLSARRIALLLLLAAALPAHAGDPALIVSVPALGVRGEGLSGVVSYILIQLDRVPSQDGPTVQFSEINFGGGSRVGDEWKESMRRAAQAVAHTVGDEGRTWLITIKSRSRTSITDGGSASAAMAVGLMAAYYGDSILQDVAISAQIMTDGRLDVVGGLPEKIEAAAAERYRVIILPRDQARMPTWNATTEAAARNQVQLILASTLRDAYQAMTGKSR